MVADCYCIERPARISYSGGRTSGYMLWHILQAYDGKLPDDIVVTFANTGKEKEATLVFVAECARRWGIPIRWIEYARDTSKPVVKWKGKRAEIGCHGFREVDFVTASRKGEPFEEIVSVKAEYRREAKNEDPILPNPVQRFCTGELKQRTMERFMRFLGFDEYSVAVGIRADEPSRIRKLMALKIPGETYCAPLGTAKVTVDDVMRFWSEQPFDLGLRHDPELGTYEGNCDLCFLKSQKKMLQLAKDDPGAFDWWAKMEEGAGTVFRRDRGSYAAIKTGRIKLKQVDDDQDTCACTD